MMGDEPLVRIRNLTHAYFRRRGPRAMRRVEALAGVDLDIARGSIVALVGQSGSGKSTLARCLARLQDPTGGEIHIDGVDALALTPARLRELRQQVQLVFQDAAGALDPRFTALEIVAEPLEILHHGTRGERRERARELMQSVGLPAEGGGRRPLDLSGGQRQRLAIARALLRSPELIILDEPTSALDADTEREVLEAIEQARVGRMLIVIAHRSSTIERADAILHLDDGRALFTSNVRARASAT
jgi:ABC-type glutathione transport system ATPase component